MSYLHTKGDGLVVLTSWDLMDQHPVGGHPPSLGFHDLKCGVL